MRFLASIDAGVATMVESETDDMMPHFIYCIGSTYHWVGHLSEKIKKMFLKKMREYEIQSSILTMLHMHRVNLITKEKSKLLAKGKLKNDPSWKDYEGSINDDLDTFINNHQNSNEMRDEGVWSFFLPKLTKEELKLVEQKNKEHMMTYFGYLGADVDVEEMKKSDSKDKYVLCYCRRKTVHLSLESKEALSENVQTF